MARQSIRAPYHSSRFCCRRSKFKFSNMVWILLSVTLFLCFTVIIFRSTAEFKYALLRNTDSVDFDSCVELESGLDSPSINTDTTVVYGYTDGVSYYSYAENTVVVDAVHCLPDYIVSSGCIHLLCVVFIFLFISIGLRYKRKKQSKPSTLVFAIVQCVLCILIELLMVGVVLIK